MSVFSNMMREDMVDTGYVDQTFTEADIELLPAPVQRYFRYCGYIGKEMVLRFLAE